MGRDTPSCSHRCDQPQAGQAGEAFASQGCVCAQSPVVLQQLMTCGTEGMPLYDLGLCGLELISETESGWWPPGQLFWHHSTLWAAVCGEVGCS